MRRWSEEGNEGVGGRKNEESMGKDGTGNNRQVVLEMCHIGESGCMCSYIRCLHSR